MRVIDKTRKPGIDVKAALKLVDAPHSDERWEGVWSFQSEGEPPDSLHATARLKFVSDLIEGRGVMSHEGHRVLDADISGVTAGDALTFTTFINGDEGVNGHLECTATLSDARSRMSGTFKHGCFNPVHCEPDCKGGWGEFEMQRIVE